VLEQGGGKLGNACSGVLVFDDFIPVTNFSNPESLRCSLDVEICSRFSKLRRLLVSLICDRQNLFDDRDPE